MNGDGEVYIYISYAISVAEKCMELPEQCESQHLEFLWIDPVLPKRFLCQISDVNVQIKYITLSLPLNTKHMETPQDQENMNMLWSC